MNNINYIESKGFRIKGRYIHKASKPSKVIGKLNDNNFYFFSDNVHPFKQGVNFFDRTTLTDGKVYKQYIKKAAGNERTDFYVHFEKYIDVTKSNSIFHKYVNGETRKWLSKNAVNHYDIRGIADGYLEDSVCFPFFNYDGNFRTAQIIRYKENGKRVKEGFNSNWFHSYKPIKKELGLKESDKYSVKIDCFFGENLLNNSDNIVGIVEAPKTAVILKEIYPNIDWIATAGESNLRNKNLGLLEDRKVILFPDAQTVQWSKVGGEYGFNVCNILDKYNADAGSDLADYIFDSSFDGYAELHEYLFALNDGDFNFEIDASALDFQFNRKKDDSFYFTAVPYFYKGKKVLMQEDDSKLSNKIFAGKHFIIYSDKYNIINAQIDWHKQDTKNEFGELMGFNEVSFKYHLQKCFRILKKLNPDSYKGIFKKTLKSLKRNSNFSFNLKYVHNVLVPMWDVWNEDLTRFYKQRDWRYNKSEQVTRKEFAQFLNDDKYRSKLNIRLKAFKDVLQDKRFIHSETDLGLSKDTARRGYSKITDLVNKWNSEVIGAKTYKTWNSRKEFFSKLESGTKNSPPYIEDSYIVEKKMYHQKSIREISAITGVKNRNTIKDFLSFKSSRDSETDIQNQINFLLDNITDVELLRMKSGRDSRTRIVGIKHIEPINEQAFLYGHKSEWSNSFGLPTTEERKGRTNSVLLRYAIMKIKREDLPPSVMESELKHLNLIYKMSLEGNNRKGKRLDMVTYVNNEKEAFYSQKEFLQEVSNF